MKTSIAVAFLSVAIAAVLSACQPNTPTGEVLRAVRTAEIRYDKAQETHHYVGTVQSRHEVNEAFRVGGKIVQRKVEVGQKVRPSKRRGSSSSPPPRRRSRPSRTANGSTR